MRVLQLGDIQLLFYALELCKMCSLPYYKGCYLLISKGGYYRGYYKGLLFGQFFSLVHPLRWHAKTYISCVCIQIVCSTHALALVVSHDCTIANTWSSLWLPSLSCRRRERYFRRASPLALNNKFGYVCCGGFGEFLALDLRCGFWAPPCMCMLQQSRLQTRNFGMGYRGTFGAVGW